MSQDRMTVHRLDHLVIAAEHLQQGIDWFHQQSGVTMPFGGEHPLMGTHNCLTALSEYHYAEIIAINPDSSPVKRQRCFALDDPEQQRDLSVSPRLITWVVATTDIQKSVEALETIGIDMGKPVEMSRGDFHWKLTVREDGSLPMGGVLPQLIQWPLSVNPVKSMQDQGIRLTNLTCITPEPEKLRQALALIQSGVEISVLEGATALRASFTVGNHSFDI